MSAVIRAATAMLFDQLVATYTCLCDIGLGVEELKMMQGV